VTSTDAWRRGCSTWSRAGPGRPTPTGSPLAARRSGNGSRFATLDPFHGYKNAIDDQLADAISVLDAFHVVKLGGQAVDEVRRRV
jgi:transposase